MLYDTLVAHRLRFAAVAQERLYVQRVLSVLHHKNEVAVRSIRHWLASERLALS